MLLKKLEISGFGPFLDPIEITFEPDVTVLTGRNDAGKTKLLRLIELLYKNETGNSDDMHFDYATRRVEDPTIGNQPTCIATFSATNSSGSLLTGKSRARDEIVLSFDVVSNHRENIRAIRNGTELPRTAVEMKGYPRLLTFSNTYVRSQIFEQNMTDVERKLLQIAFGNKPFDSLRQLNTQQLDRQRDAGSDNLTRKLNELTSPTFGLRIQVDVELGEQAYIGIRLKDSINGNSPLDSRGTGIRKILTLLALFADLQNNTTPTMILIDEPENSLHADAQHLLRRFLEKVAEHEFI
jgi:predicted ATP-dependent endonuclease of OLD family